MQAVICIGKPVAISGSYSSCFCVLLVALFRWKMAGKKESLRHKTKTCTF